MPQKKRVAAYCRVSTLEQKKKGHGIEIQVRDVTLFAQSHGLFVERFYKDEGKSGADEDRESLTQLLRDCRARKIGTIIIPSLDRLSRNVRLAENLFWKFECLGIQVLIADMPSYNGQDRKDVLIRQIREAIAEEERRQVVERLWKGRCARILRGEPPGGNVPYGYRRRNKMLLPDPEEAAIVREILSLESLGKSCSEIVDVLNERGLGRRNGKPWTPRQVLAILARSCLYKMGEIRYGEAKGQNSRLILLN